MFIQYNFLSFYIYTVVTKLAIQELPTKDCRTLRLIDNSSYNPAIPVTCSILEITLPGKDCPVAFNVEKDFNTVFNSSLLGINKATCYSDLIPLPEGVYKIKYSINPNTVLYEEYEYLRNCQQLDRYYKAVCSLFTSRCDISKKDFEEKRKKLIWIKELIDAAKYNVEECENSERGLELYDEANDLLSDFNNNCCNTCR